MIVEAASLIPGDEDRCICPVGTVHDGTGNFGHEVFPSLEWQGRVICIVPGRIDPGHCSHLDSLHILDELGAIFDDILFVVCIEALDDRRCIPDGNRTIVTPAYACIVQLLRQAINEIAGIGPVWSSACVHRVEYGILWRVAARTLRRINTSGL